MERVSGADQTQQMTKAETRDLLKAMEKQVTVMMNYFTTKTDDKKSSVTENNAYGILALGAALMQGIIMTGANHLTAEIKKEADERADAHRKMQGLGEPVEKDRG